MAKGMDEIHSVKKVIDYHIYTLAKNSHVEYEELFQIGYEGYLKARKNYNPEYGQMTLKYASKYIRHEILNALKREWSFGASHHAEKEEICEEEYYEGTSNPTDDKRIATIEECLKKLPKQHRDIIKRYYLDSNPKRLKDLAEKWGISKQRIHQIKEQGLEMIREMMNVDT